MWLVEFYRGEGTDYDGRRLDDILAWDDEQLDAIHNFIQVLFPLREPSLFSYRAPVLDDATVAAFRSDERLRANLARSFERMLRFYGFRYDAESGKVLRAENFAEQTRYWLAPFDHNYRRITRILSSLSILGLEQPARAFFDALAEVYAESARDIGEETFRYWQNAVSLRGEPGA